MASKRRREKTPRVRTHFRVRAPFHPAQAPEVRDKLAPLRVCVKVQRTIPRPDLGDRMAEYACFVFGHVALEDLHERARRLTDVTVLPPTAQQGEVPGAKTKNEVPRAMSRQRKRCAQTRGRDMSRQRKRRRHVAQERHQFFLCGVPRDVSPGALAASVRRLSIDGAAVVVEPLRALSGHAVIFGVRGPAEGRVHTRCAEAKAALAAVLGNCEGATLRLKLESAHDDGVAPRHCDAIVVLR